MLQYKNDTLFKNVSGHFWDILTNFSWKELYLIQELLHYVNVILITRRVTEAVTLKVKHY
jgi:hypothetical protein